MNVARSNHHAILGSGDDGEAVIARLDHIGCGMYQRLLVLGVGVFMCSESIEMGAVAPLHTALASSFGMTAGERVSLPACVYQGSVVGMVLAGPLADLFGRRGTLLIALIGILTSSLTLAVLPLWMPVGCVLLLRAIAGVAGAIGTPAAIALAVESCNSESRVNIMFAIMFFSSLGYLCEAIGVAFFMPEFGEGPHDSWRGMSLFIATPSLISLPMVWILGESPCFLAVRGNISECIECLNYIAWWNGKPPSKPTPAPEMLEVVSESKSSVLLDTLACIFRSYLSLVLLLLAIESSRAFWFSGSAYVCKDLFMMVGSSIPPSTMNMASSVTPLIGIVVGSRFASLGARRVTFIFSAIAAASIMLLTSEAVRLHMLLVCVLTFKLTFGTISTCVSLMRVEAFPTEIRASAFAIVSIAGKELCMLGPMLVEILKQSEYADSWRKDKLAIYLSILAGSAMCCGVLALFVPLNAGSGRKLHDFVLTKNGECVNMLDEEEGEAMLKEDDHFREISDRAPTGLRHGMTYGSIIHIKGTRGIQSATESVAEGTPA